jgi:hypothetical protein
MKALVAGKMRNGSLDQLFCAGWGNASARRSFKINEINVVATWRPVGRRYPSVAASQNIEIAQCFFTWLLGLLHRLLHLNKGHLPVSLLLECRRFLAQVFGKGSTRIANYGVTRSTASTISFPMNRAKAVRMPIETQKSNLLSGTEAMASRQCRPRSAHLRATVLRSGR